MCIHICMYTFVYTRMPEPSHHTSCNRTNMFVQKGVRQRQDATRRMLIVRVPQSKLPILILAPRIHFFLGGDGEAMPHATH